ncbi:hypothetical protein DIE17_01695 [Burkholderia sp. Bp9099]|nr:hypothetical protein DIE17_01695 [Burkholderia sp. Bp9099]
MNFIMKKPTWTDYYHENAEKHGVTEVMADPDYRVFALQEMANGANKKDQEGFPKGDASMFGSVMSLMKAQFYELETRGKVKRDEPRFYQFNLVSLAETQFVKLNFTEDEISAEELDIVHYVGSYIFNGKNDSSNIIFCTKKAFPRILEDFGRLHEANKIIARDKLKEFYTDVLSSPAKTDVLLPRFREELDSEIWWMLLDWEDYSSDKLQVFRGKEGDIELHLMSSNADLIRYMNGDEHIMKGAQAALKKIYKYEGQFTFE